ncbi:MAG: 16S rRNA (guanine(527)-N(7))-methyltransferase RsmG [Oscillospiraceae bacterium]|nr:16S rRNA (guanine(527)-N(7))-methyltransferase RsmG [Oscillospiraceae bacterium]
MNQNEKENLIDGSSGGARLEEILSSGLTALSIPFTDKTLQAFRQYYTLLEEKNRQMNLTAINGEEETARLHFLDCAAILSLLPSGDLSVLDVGSGAGFPGLVLKLLRPDLSLTLLDSQKKRVLFQEDVCDALGLQDVSCLALRAEEAPAVMRESFDVVVSRAVARLNILSELCLPFVRPGGLFLSMKGPAAAEELKECHRAFRLLGGGNASLLSRPVPGLDAGRLVVRVEKAAPTPPKYPRRFSQIKKQPL